METERVWMTSTCGECSGSHDIPLTNEQDEASREHVCWCLLTECGDTLPIQAVIENRQTGPRLDFYSQVEGQTREPIISFEGGEAKAFVQAIIGVAQEGDPIRGTSEWYVWAWRGRAILQVPREGRQLAFSAREAVRFAALGIGVEF